jgi:glycosyltransferase involved in cell wall biosynthesis
MPHVTFDAWGAALMDKAPDLSDMPANVTLRRPFASMGELPLDEADGWLYTAAWDGLPTLLIELAMAGMPIVASAVGGVPELITPETGWPVTEVDDVDAYVRALKQLIAQPEERVRRAGALQTLAGERHRAAAYEARLAELIGLGGDA